MNLINKYTKKIIKYTSINVSIYIINSFLISIFDIQIVLHILGFGIIFIFLDALILVEDLKIMENNYNNLLKYTNINLDVNIIKTKLDFLTSIIKLHLSQEINSERSSSPEFDYNLARKSLVSSKSLSFGKKTQFKVK